MKYMYSFIFTLILLSCSENNESVTTNSDLENADIQNVQVTGSTGSYSFSVTIASPDTGCEQYANWWEVLSEDGALIYRRILGHSHVNEQPFTRSGGPVNISEEQTVLVRAHMNNSGYGGVVYQGTVKGGFNAVNVAEGFAAEVESEAPQPGACPF